MPACAAVGHPWAWWSSAQIARQARWHARRRAWRRTWRVCDRVWPSQRRAHLGLFASSRPRLESTGRSRQSHNSPTRPRTTTTWTTWTTKALASQTPMCVVVAAMMTMMMMMRKTMRKRMRRRGWMRLATRCWCPSLWSDWSTCEWIDAGADYDDDAGVRRRSRCRLRADCRCFVWTKTDCNSTSPSTRSRKWLLSSLSACCSSARHSSLRHCTNLCQCSTFWQKRRTIRLNFELSTNCGLVHFTSELTFRLRGVWLSTCWQEEASAEEWCRAMFAQVVVEVSWCVLVWKMCESSRRSATTTWVDCRQPGRRGRSPPSCTATSRSCPCSRCRARASHRCGGRSTRRRSPPRCHTTQRLVECSWCCFSRSRSMYIIYSDCNSFVRSLVMISAPLVLLGPRNDSLVRSHSFSHSNHVYMSQRERETDNFKMCNFWMHICLLICC